MQIMSSININRERGNSGNSEKEKSAKEIADSKKKELRAKLGRTIYLLEYVSGKLDALNIDSFDILFPEVLNKMREAAFLREELIKELGFEVLIKICPQLFSTAKLIEEKYDNLVENYSIDTQRMRNELSVVGNRQKITNYLRY